MENLDTNPTKEPSYRPFWGVRVPLGATPVEALAALMKRLPPSAVVAGQSAATLHGLPFTFGPLADDWLRYPCIAVGKGTSRIRRSNVRGVRLSLDLDFEVVTRQGIPVTTVSRTWFDLSTLISARYLQMFTNSALSAQLTTLDELGALKEKLKHRPGHHVRTRTLAYANSQVRSEEESLLCAVFSEANLVPTNLGESRRGPQSAQHSQGYPLAYFPKKKLVAQYVGHHLNDPSAGAFLKQQRDALREGGLRVITVTGTDLLEPTLMLARFRHAAARGG